MHSSSEIANRAIELIKETFTNLGPKLRSNQVIFRHTTRSSFVLILLVTDVLYYFFKVEIHNKFIQICTNRIQESAKVLLNSNDEDEKVNVNKLSHAGEAIKVVRCLTVLREYVSECDDDHLEERAILPHGR